MAIDMDDKVEAAIEIEREKLPPNSKASKEAHKEAEDSTGAVISTKKQITPAQKFTVRKKTLWQRIKEAYIGDDFKSIPEFLLFDVIIPSTKRLFRDSVDGMLDRAFGQGSRSKPRTDRVDSGYLVNYNGYYQDGSPRPRSIRPGIQFSDFWFSNKDDAEEKLLEISNLFTNNYEGITVLQVKELFGIRKYSNQDNSYGWMNMRNAGVIPYDGGWIISMPPAKYLD